MFAVAQAIFVQTESELQLAMQLLYNITQKYNLEISIKKSKVMAFQGKYPVRCKTMTIRP
jgi:hypothetical protein